MIFLLDTDTPILYNLTNDNELVKLIDDVKCEVQNFEENMTEFATVGIFGETLLNKFISSNNGKKKQVYVFYFNDSISMILFQ